MLIQPNPVKIYKKIKIFFSRNIFLNYQPAYPVNCRPFIQRCEDSRKSLAPPVPEYQLPVYPQILTQGGKFNMIVVPAIRMPNVLA